MFIGYDRREAVATHVLAHSILRRSRLPVAITPLVRGVLPITRPRGPTESTDFSLSRFLVPYLAGYSGLALFLDCDMVLRGDVADLFDMATGNRCVWVAKHEYVPKTVRKFLGQVQTVYPRKNWSSVMLFDCARCSMLTPEYVDTAHGLELHRFMWCDESDIGSLPLEWNWLVGEYDANPQAKLLHYTLGGPYFHEYRNTEHAAEWLAEYSDMQTPLGE